MMETAREKYLQFVGKIETHASQKSTFSSAPPKISHVEIIFEFIWKLISARNKVVHIKK